MKKKIYLLKKKKTKTKIMASGPISSGSSVAQSCPTLCDPMDYSPPGSSVRGILQARILEWLPCPSPGDLPNPGIKPASLMSPALVGEFFTTNSTWEAPNMCVCM